MKKTLFAVLSLVIAVLLLFTSCGTPVPAVLATHIVDSGYADDAAQQAVFGEGYADGKEGFPIVCIQSVEELDAFTALAKEHFPKVNMEVESSDALTYQNVVKQYDEDFFQEKAVLICYAYTTASPAEFEVTGSNANDRSVAIWVRAEAIGTDAAMEGRIIFAQVQKSTLAGIDSFFAIKSNA